MVSKIKKGDLAYWKCNNEFGIVHKVSGKNKNIAIYIKWDNSKNVFDLPYSIEDLQKDGQLVIGKLVKFLYAKV